MIKAIVLDVDGTLLNQQKEIDRPTINKLIELSDNVKIILASARGFYRIKKYIDKLRIDNENQYTIAYNGSVVVKNNGERMIDVFISKSNILVLVDFIKQYSDYHWSLYSYDFKLYSNNIEDIDDFVCKNHIYKVVAEASESQIEKLRSEIPNDFFSKFEITCSELTRIEFVKKGITKVTAIQYLNELLGIQENEMVAIGDGENDIAMIEYAGVGIAMGNAPMNVKEKADYVTGNCDNNGVAEAIEYLQRNNLL